MDVGGCTWDKRFDVMINIERYILRRGAISGKDGSTWVAGFVDLGKEIEAGRFDISGGEKFVGLLGEMFAHFHVIKGRLNLCGKIMSGVRIKRCVVQSIVEMLHCFIDVLLAVHDDYGRSFVCRLDDDVRPVPKG